MNYLDPMPDIDPVVGLGHQTGKTGHAMTKMKYMTRLVRKASKSEHRYQHATLLCRGGSIVACACNRPGVHSEIAALNKVKRDKRRGLTFINIRIRRDGSLGLSRPCLACQRRFKAEGITRGSYTIDRWTWGGIWL
jgi:hypothetical protein